MRPWPSKNTYCASLEEYTSFRLVYCACDFNMASKSPSYTACHSCTSACCLSSAFSTKLDFTYFALINTSLSTNEVEGPGLLTIVLLSLWTLTTPQLPTYAPATPDAPLPAPGSGFGCFALASSPWIKLEVSPSSSSYPSDDSNSSANAQSDDMGWFCVCVLAACGDEVRVASHI